MRRDHARLFQRLSNGVSVALSGVAAKLPIPPRYRKAAAMGAAVIVVAGLVALFWSGDDMPPPRKIHELTIVNITPPPPPPTPPPPPPEQKMIEQPKLTEREIKEEKPVETPKEAPPQDSKDDNEPPPGPLALDAKADGPPDSFNLAGNPGGRGLLGGGGGGGGSRWGWYAAMVQKEIESAVRANPKTRNAVMQVLVRLWADSSGRVTRVQLGSSTGNPDVDAALRNEVLMGIVLRDPPPKDMPMPLVTRVTAHRPT